MTQLHSPQMAGVERELITMAPNRFPELFYSSYAMGWVVTSYRGNILLHHGGSIDGFHAQVAFLPDKNLGVVTLTNTDTNMLEVAATYHTLDLLLGVEPAAWHDRYFKIYQGLVGTAKQAREAAHADRVPDTSPSHELAAYTGTFEHSGYGKVEIELKDGQLLFSYNALTGPLDHFHYDSFIVSADEFDADLKVMFNSNARGDIESLTAPFEEKVADIVFKRVASKKLSEKSYLTQFAGEYEIELGDMPIAVTVSLQGDVLVADAPGQSDELEPYKENEFRLKSAPSQIITFLRDTDGQINAARLPGGITAKRKA